ncbi:hypothetical protein [Bradyrhizobium jicamae]|uniref:hypothetical protein n=1 Tax=Bradyrhizobium jicamae TaxID=280332 RepID=UPI0007C6F632|nr:hypothetical protein [Bradyrhizobium jicamae]
MANLIAGGCLTGRMAPDQHVQAIIVAIDQYAEKALGNREYFLNKPYGGCTASRPVIVRAALVAIAGS